MKVEVMEDSAVERRLEIEVPAERVDDTIEDQYQEVQRTAHVKGFRPGKVPRKMLEKLFKDYVGQKAMEALVKETLETAMDRKQITPVAEPIIDPAEVKKGEPFAYTVHVEVHPVVEAKDYKGLEIEHTEQKVSDEDFEKNIEMLRERFATIKEPDQPRGAREDDQITAHLKVTENGEVIEEDAEGDESEIELWRESWIPDLAGQIKGKKAGDTVSFHADIEDSEKVPERFRGKSLDFQFDIRMVKERVLPELDDEFAKTYTCFETLEELKKSVRDGLEENAARSSKNELHYALVGKLIESNPIEVPPSLVKIEALQMAKDFMSRTVGRQPTDEEAAQFTPMFEEEAKKSFQANYILDSIAEQEGIVATDEDVDEKLKEDAERMGMDADKLKARLEGEQIEALKKRLALDKALDFLVSVANIKEKAADKD